jgi:hypothetical protein
MALAVVSGSPSRYIGCTPSSLSSPGVVDGELSGRWADFRYVRDLLSDECVNGCRRSISKTAGGVVSVCRQVSADGRVCGSFKGLSTCKSVWLCPMCSARISERRAIELNDAVKAAESQGLLVVLVTVTFSHSASDSLSDTLSAFRSALRRSRSGRDWHALQQEFSPLGYVRALEVTHGSNGWHPHAHELWFLPAQTDATAFAAAYEARWLKAMSYAGLSGNEHAFRCDVSRGGIAAYVAKFGREPRWGPGRELAKASHKRGRRASATPWQLLRMAREGDADACGWFLDYASAFKGCRQLQWSPGLRAQLVLPEPLTDDEAAADDAVCVDGAVEVVAVLDGKRWYRVYYNDREHAVLEMVINGASGPEVLAYVDTLRVPGDGYVPRRL